MESNDSRHLKQSTLHHELNELPRLCVLLSNSVGTQRKKIFDSLRLQDVPKESLKLGLILVRIKAVALNWRDGIVAIGTFLFSGPDIDVPGSYGAGQSPPAGMLHVSWHIYTGIIEDISESLWAWKLGDRVLANYSQVRIAGPFTR